MRRVCYVTQYDGLYYRIEFMGRFGPKKAHANVVCHENEIAIYVSNWIQSGVVSNKMMLGSTPYKAVQ
jgi:hypothetical protein